MTAEAVRGEPAAQVRDLVLGAVRETWENGYQPADVLRVARRRLGEGDVMLLRAVLAAELVTYARGTVDRRWLDQVGGAAEAASRAVSWSAVGRRADVLLSLLRGLPRLERLGPLPGSANATGASDDAAVDTRILERVRALLAKAESTTYPEEAETFTAGAQALMARHRIDAAMIEARGDRPGGSPDAVRLGIDPPYESAKVSLLTAVASANRCRTVWTRSLGFCTVVGFGTDLEVVETLFTSLLVQATRAVTRQGPRLDGSGRSRTRAFRHAFLLAFAQRIGERLAEESARLEHETATAAGGERLLPVLAARDAEVERALTELFPHLRYSRTSRVGDVEGWASGRAAADLADVGHQGRLDPGRP